MKKFCVVPTKCFLSRVFCRNLYSFVVYLYVNGSGSITSVREESCCLPVIMWFLFGEVSSSFGCFGWATLLAHLSRRLIGELIVYPCSGVRRLCCCRRRRRPPFSNIFSSETA